MEGEARDGALAAAQADGLELRRLGEFRADKDLSSEAAKQSTGHGSPEPYASDELKDDYDIGLLAVKSNGLALDQAGLDNASLVTEAVSRDGRALQYASENLRRDTRREMKRSFSEDNFVVMEALKSDPEALGAGGAGRLRDSGDRCSSGREFPP
eukprot:Skav202540  [mRNA]  locus=scaffold2011:246866:249099:- [translate_table: standard]